MLHCSAQESQSSLAKQLEVCLARQVQLHNAKRHGPLQALVTDELAGNPAMNPAVNPRGQFPFGAIPWPHPSQHSLDSQVSRTQLTQAAIDRADFFKVIDFISHLQECSSS